MAFLCRAKEIARDLPLSDLHERARESLTSDLGDKNPFNSTKKEAEGCIQGTQKMAGGGEEPGCEGGREQSGRVAYRAVSPEDIEECHVIAFRAQKYLPRPCCCVPVLPG
jgi:hypothetical protein